jgi:hypothetical protein
MSFLLNKDLGIENIYYGGMFLAAFEMLGYISSSFIIHRLGRRTINITCIIISFTISLVLFIMGLVKNISHSEKTSSYKITEAGKI